MVVHFVLYYNLISNQNNVLTVRKEVTARVVGCIFGIHFADERQLLVALVLFNASPPVQHITGSRTPAVYLFLFGVRNWKHGDEYHSAPALEREEWWL